VIRLRRRSTLRCRRISLGSFDNRLDGAVLEFVPCRQCPPFEELPAAAHVKCGRYRADEQRSGTRASSRVSEMARSSSGDAVSRACLVQGLQVRALIYHRASPDSPAGIDGRQDDARQTGSRASRNREPPYRPERGQRDDTGASGRCAASCDMRPPMLMPARKTGEAAARRHECHNRPRSPGTRSRVNTRAGRTAVPAQSSAGRSTSRRQGALPLRRARRPPGPDAMDEHDAGGGADAGRSPHRSSSVPVVWSSSGPRWSGAGWGGRPSCVSFLYYAPLPRTCRE